MKKLKELFATDKNIIQKSFIITIILLAFVVTGFGAAFYSSKQCQIALHQVYEKHTMAAQKLIAITEKSDDIRYRMMAVVADKLPAVGAKKKIESLQIEIEEKWKEFQAMYDSSKLNKEDLETYKKLEGGYTLYKATITKAIELLSKDDKSKLGDLLEEDWAQVITDFLNPLRKISQNEVGAIKKTYEMATASSKLFIFSVVVGFFFVSIIGTYALYFFAKMRKNSLQVIEDLSNVGMTMFATAETVRKASESLSEVTTTNKQSIHETSTALEEIAAMVKQSAANAEKSKNVATATTESARDGEKTVKEMINAIDVISSTTTSMVTQMDETSKNLQKIENIFAEVE